MAQDHEAVDCVVFIISTAAQYRDAIARLRFLEGTLKNASLAREREALELAVSRYLTQGERPLVQERNDPRS